jgi:hypothetical protein
MDLIEFLCVSLSSDKVQLHDSLGIRRACACSEAGFNSQNGDLARSVLLKSNVPLCVFSFGVRRHNAKDIYKEMFPVYGGKCLSRKAVQRR